jgi:hypothetical protein
MSFVNPGAIRRSAAWQFAQTNGSRILMRSPVVDSSRNHAPQHAARA